MSQRATASLEEHFGDLPDPRVQELIEHRLLDIILITICAVICGADGWEDVAEFGKSKVEWLRTFLELPNGIPSHDTFGRVFARLDPEAFGQRFVGWIRAMEKVTAGQVIAVDGKTVRRSYDHRLGKKAIPYHCPIARCKFGTVQNCPPAVAL